MYPIRSKVIKNTFFLGEQLPSASDLVYTDSGVSSLRMQIQNLEMQLQTMRSTASVPLGVSGFGKHKFTPNRGLTAQEIESGEPVSLWGITDTGDRTKQERQWYTLQQVPMWQTLHNQFNALKAQIASAKSRMVEAEQQVRDRLKKEAEDQAKRDADMAKTKASADAAASNTSRIATLITNSKTEGTVAAAPSAAPSNLGKYLLVGGAAVAALVLMK